MNTTPIVDRTSSTARIVTGRAVVVLVCISAFACGNANRSEIARLSTVAGWGPGAMVADVGAGKGGVALAAARIVGPSGVVYATELGSNNVNRLRRGVKNVSNIRVVAATATSTGLPASCCDSVYLRGVYHHLSKPLETDADIYRALRAGGRLVVIDFPPKRFLSWFFAVKDVPANRGGHGVRLEIVKKELRDAGFEIEQQLEDWPGGQYCVVARKPEQTSDPGQSPHKSIP